MEGETFLSSHVHEEEDGESISIQGCTLNTNSPIKIENDPANLDSEIYPTHPRPLTEDIDAPSPNKQTKDLSADITIPSVVSDQSNRALTLNLLNQANLPHNITGFRAMLGALTCGCIRFTTELQRSSESFLLYDPLEQNLTPSSLLLWPSTV